MIQTLRRGSVTLIEPNRRKLGKMVCGTTELSRYGYIKGKEKNIKFGQM